MNPAVIQAAAAFRARTLLARRQRIDDERQRTDALIRQIFDERAPSLRGHDGADAVPPSSDEIMALVRQEFDARTDLLRGRDGENGLRGSRGETGAAGRAGLDGENGINGLNGAAGEAGLRGEQGAQGEPGPPGTPGKAGLVWRGEWTRSTQYVKGDAVSWTGSSFVARRRSTAELPTVSPTAWDVLAARGAQGAAFVASASSVTTATRTVTGDTTAQAADDVIFVNSPTAAVVTLMNAATRTRALIVKRLGSGLVTVTAPSGTIDDSSPSRDIALQYDALQFTPSGGNWYVT